MEKFRETVRRHILKEGKFQLSPELHHFALSNHHSDEADKHAEHASKWKKEAKFNKDHGAEKLASQSSDISNHHSHLSKLHQQIAQHHSKLSDLHDAFDKD